MVEFLIGILVGLAAGTAVGFVVGAMRARAAAQQVSAQLQQDLAVARANGEQLQQQLTQRQQELAAIAQSLEQEKLARVRSATQLDEAGRNVQAQKDMLDQARTNLGDAFKALSAEALRTNNQAFIEMARQVMDNTLVQAGGDLDKRRLAIDALVKPLQDIMARYETQIAAMENSRQNAYGGLVQQVQNLAMSQQQLQRETGNLVTALRRPEIRGRWGELTLRRVMELSGLSDHCDYAEQVSVEGQRPDMVVNLPGGRQIVIDAKIALDAYLDAIAAGDDATRNECLTRHARQMRAHMEKLAAKEYSKQFEQAPEFVVMFIPGESFFAAAVDVDRSLIEDGMARQVILATPTTLVSLMRAVALGWRQEQIAANAKEISDLGKDLHERLQVFRSHVVTMGVNLKRALEAHDKMVGSWESRVMPAARRFKELGSTGGAEIEPIEQIGMVPRMMENGEQADAASPIEPQLPEAKGEST